MNQVKFKVKVQQIPITKQRGNTKQQAKAINEIINRNLNLDK
jgi:hypothetical protein